MAKDGGPAFPFTRLESGEHGGPMYDVTYPGMSFRQYAAVHAMVGVFSNSDPELMAVLVKQDDVARAVAVLAVDAADALIAELEKDQ